MDGGDIRGGGRGRTSEDVGIVEGNDITSINLVRDCIATNVVGTGRPQLIVAIYVTDDDGLAGQKGKKGCRKVLRAR